MNFLQSLFRDTLSTYSIKFVQIALSMSALVDFRVREVTPRNGSCGAFDYMFTLSELGYSSSSQLEYMLASGNYWGFRNCASCPQDCAAAFSDMPDYYKLVLIPRNSFGDWLKSSVSSIETHLRITETEQTGWYNVSFFHNHDSIFMNDVWRVKTIQADGVSYPAITVHTQNGFERMILVPYDVFSA